MTSPADTNGTAARAPAGTHRAERDIVALGIIVAALILFVSSGATVLPRTLHHLLFGGVPADAVLSNALLLNIALIIFGWRRYAELTAEVRERRKAEDAARQLAYTDPLTGCLNRRSLDGAITALVEEARSQDKAVALLVLDLDKFKRANDLHGHQMGDAVLVETASRLRAILPEEAIIARIGGDEFTCALPFEAAHPETVELMAEQLLVTLSEPISLAGHAVEVSGSLGLARSDTPDIAPQTPSPQVASQLQHFADLAMYYAKSCGRGRYAWFEPTMEKELRFRAELETGIREGIPRGEFVPYYEKQIDLDTGRLTGFEMLARWHSPRYGLIAPDVFIPVAEEIGLIAPLSECLIRQALIDAREWDPSLTLSVNISPMQLRDPWFAQRMLKLLVETNFPAHRLDIEITETCLHENLPVVRSLVASLKNQGIGISLDDFGTGYSSIAQLRSLPFDRIKIDRSFVSTLDSCQDSATIVSAITSLGKGLRLPLTAEGIASDAVLAELRKLGSFKGQGYLYGQPQPASAVRTALAEQGLLAPALTQPAPALVSPPVSSAPSTAPEPDQARRA